MRRRSALPLSPAEIAAFNAATPNRLAFKHAHSQRNPETGLGPLHAAGGRVRVLGAQRALWPRARRSAQTLRTIRPHNTLVIASSVSNGGGAAIAAAEQDDERLIDAVVVSEPAVQLPGKLPIRIKRGATTIATFGKPLFDYTTLRQRLQPLRCALAATRRRAVPSHVRGRLRLLRDQPLRLAEEPRVCWTPARRRCRPTRRWRRCATRLGARVGGAVRDLRGLRDRRARSA